jgi:hypothetical protein
VHERRGASQVAQQRNVESIAARPVTKEQEEAG